MRRMLRCALLVVATSCAVSACEPGTSVAIKVGDREVSRDAIADELEVLHDHPTLAKIIVGLDPSQALALGEGSLPGQVATSWLSFRTVHLVLAAELDRRGEAVKAADREQARDLLRAIFGSALRRAPRDFVDGFIDDFAPRYAIGRDEGLDPDGDDDQAAFQDVLLTVGRRAQVQLDPRYGTWSRSDARVVAPSVHGRASPGVVEGRRV